MKTVAVLQALMYKSVSLYSAATSDHVADISAHVLGPSLFSIDYYE